METLHTFPLIEIRAIHNLMKTHCSVPVQRRAIVEEKHYKKLAKTEQAYGNKLGTQFSSITGSIPL